MALNHGHYAMAADWSYEINKCWIIDFFEITNIDISMTKQTAFISQYMFF